MKTMSLGWIALSASLLAPRAWAQSAGAGGAVDDPSAAGAGGEPTAPSASGAPGAPAAAGADGAAAGGAGGVFAGGAGGEPEPPVPPPNEYDLLENDGGRACSVGGAGAASPGLMSLVLGAAWGASILRRRRRK